MSGPAAPGPAGRSGPRPGVSPRVVAGGLAATAGLIGLVTLASRVLGLGRWVAFSQGVGATCVGQAYASANQLPNVLFEVAAGGALAAVVVPLVSARLNRGEEEQADRIASALLTWALTLLVPLGVLVALAARPLAAALLGDAPGCAAAVDTAALMLVVFAPQVPLYGVGIVLAGVLQAHRRFVAAALAPLLSSLVVILTYLLYGALTGAGPVDRPAVLLLAAGTTLGVVVLSLPLFVPALRAGVRLRPTWRFPSGTAGRAGALATAGVVAVAGQQAAVLATVWLANRADGVGVVNVYGYVQAVYLLPYAVLAVPLATAAFPRLTAPDEAAATLSRGLRGVLVAGVAGAAVLVAVRREVGTVFLALDAGSDEAGRAALEAMPVALGSYAPGLVGFALAALLSRALYARGSALTAGAAVSAGWLVAAAVPLAVLAGRPGDPATTLTVLGASSSAGMSLTAVVLLVAVARVWGAGVLHHLGRTAVAVVLGGGAVVAARELAQPVLPDPGWLGALLLAAAVSVVLLLAVTAAVRVADPAVLRLLARLRPGGGSMSG